MWHQLKTSSFILVWLRFLMAAHLQASEIPDKQFYFRHIRTEQGLSNGIINDILKDKKGFLWIATLNGLNCYDGAHFFVWKADPRDSNKLYNDAVYGLCEGDSNDIWCSTNAGVSRLDRHSDTFKNYELINKVTGMRSLGSSNTILQTRKGQIVTYSFSGVYIYDHSKDEFIHYPEVEANGGMDCKGVVDKSFIEDPERNGIWIGTSDGLKYFDLDTKIYFSYKNNPEKLPVFTSHYSGPVTLDKDNNLVFADGDDQRIYTYLFSTRTLSFFSPENPFGKPLYFDYLLSDRSGNLWMSVDDAAVLYKEKKSGKTFTVKHTNEQSHSLAAEYFLDALQDSSGTIYLGTVNGISFLNPEHQFISVFPFPDTIRNNRRFYLHQLLNCDRQNGIWFAPSYQYLLKFNTADQSYRTYDILEKLRKTNTDDILISAMAADDSSLYFGTLDGIYMYDVADDSFRKLNVFASGDNIDGRYILCMLLTQDKELWFSSHKNGLFRYNIRTGAYKHYPRMNSDSSGITADYIYSMLEDSKGVVWFCTEKNGLVRYNKQQDAFDYLQTKPSGREAEVYYSFTTDQDNNLWVLSFLEGLKKFDTRTNTFDSTSRLSGLANFRYNHILTDNHGRLWLSYYSEYSVADTKTGLAKNFRVDFAQTNNAYANYSCLLPDGRIVAESRNGFLIFDPSAEYNKRAPVTISGFSDGNKTFPFLLSGSEMRLKSSQNFFSLNFSSLSILEEKDLLFAYKLEGVNEDWVYCRNRQTAYFTNVSGGNYLFRVKMQNTDGSWTECPDTVKISVDKKFYATIWFRLLLVLILVVCVLWYIRIFRKKTLKKESDKAIAYFANSLQGKNKVEELVWDITHNVITRTDLVDCVVYLLDKEKNVLIQKAAFGNKNIGEHNILNPLEIPIGNGIVGSVAKSGKAEIVGDTSRDPRYITDDSSRMSEIAVPIVADGKVIGVIDSEHPRKNFFTRQHLQLLQTIASITATKIVKAQREMEVDEKEKHLRDLQNQINYTRQQALQAQMNPHFIFNCLNSINGFILQNDVGAASTFLIKFSKLIRLILEHSNEKTISLQSELDALKLYIDMESLRFGKKFSCFIQVDIDVMPDAVRVPPLILQPFVENAIWHGLLHKESDGVLTILVHQQDSFLECVIEDNGVGREAAAEFKSKKYSGSKSLGMKLTTERLALLNKEGNKDSSVRVEDLRNETGAPAGTRVTIRVSLSNE
ncbi:MAG TPA: histidine kinase [Bacteroidia bacterium]|nr:histidine kinase [Bacteroidia bacterium]